MARVSTSPFPSNLEDSNPHPFPKAPPIAARYPADQLTPEGKPIGISPAATLQNGHRPRWINIGPPVDRIVEMISRYLYRDSPEDKFEATGRDALKPIVSRYVEAGEKIELIFPGFPFKAPSKNRVLGSLPDLAEELLLRRLEMLALSIEDYHSAGVVIRIVSDGVVYGEILEQSDSVVYQYNAELRRMISEFGLSHISCIRVTDLLDPSPAASDTMTEEEYISSIPDVRARFLAHEVPGFEVETALKSDVGVFNTYQAYIKFLADGFPARKEHELEQIAKRMLKNGAIFSDLVTKKFQDAIRLSCHAHDNAGPKYAFNMFPGAARAASPWHNTVLHKIDSSLVIGHVHDFDPSTYEIIHRNGRPYYLRERSLEWDLGDKVNPYVTLTPNMPYGLIIKADPAAGLSYLDLPMDKIRTLSIRHSLVIIQGFAPLNEECFIKQCDGLGQIINWYSLGAIVKLKETPDFDMNTTLTTEAMPMHFDGLFKVKNLANGEVTNDVPVFQVFQCINAPGNGQGGRTMITNATHVLHYGLTDVQRDWLSTRSSISFTSKTQAFGGIYVKIPLIVHNEQTGHDVLRWVEKWPQYATKFNPAESTIYGVPPAVSDEVGDYLTDLLYDRRFCYSHEWTTGDFLIADNVETVHSRTAFKSCSRELWRIHVD